MKNSCYVLVTLLIVLLSSCQQDESSYALATSAEDAAREIGFISMDVSKSKSRSSVGVKINDDWK